MPGFVQGIGGGQRVFKNFAKIVGRYIKQAAILSAANIGFPPRGSQGIRQKYKLPPRGKLLAKQGDEGGNLFSARMSLHDIATAPHLSTLLTASPQGEAKK